MKFRDDINLEETWVTSDSHFGHERIKGFSFRPDDHEEAMLAEWRKVVPDDATVLHLGDLVFSGNARFKNIIAPQLTGARKLLILGNHDHQRYSFYRDCGFKIIRPFAIKFPVWNDVEATISFSHYPWNPEFDGGRIPFDHFRIHGHIHNAGYTREAFVPFLAQHINVSVEQTHLSPVNLKLLLDAAVLGNFPQTSEASLAEAQHRKEANLEA